MCILALRSKVALAERDAVDYLLFPRVDHQGSVDPTPASV